MLRRLLRKLGYVPVAPRDTLMLNDHPLLPTADYEVRRVGLGAVEVLGEPFVLNDGSILIGITLQVTATRRRKEH